VEFYNVPEGEFGKNGSRLALKAEVERNILEGVEKREGFPISQFSTPNAQ
jgi:hypothetical protein